VVAETQHLEVAGEPVKGEGVLEVVILPVLKVLVGLMMLQQQWIMLSQQS
jgi:hypothetical protein